MDIGRAILWSSVALVGSGTIGYGFGFWEARPALDALVIVGTLTGVLAAITVAAMVLAFLRARSLHLSLGCLPGTPRIGLVWSGLAIFASINIGAFFGFAIGLRTAESVTDILSGIGVVAILVASAAILIGIIYVSRSGYKWNRRR